MATSGVYNLSLTFEDVRDEVLDRLQVIGDGETVTTAMSDRVKKTTNMMIKFWEAQGIHLWTYKEGTLFLQVGKAEYDFTSNLVHISNNWSQTSVAVDATALDTSITVTDDTDITNGDNIGIIDSNGDLFWTTVNGVPFANVVQLTTALPTDVTAGAIVFNYNDTYIPVRRILNVRRRDSTDYEIPINFESRKDYFDLPNKNQLGLPIQAYYSRQEPQGKMYLWTTPSSATSVINFTYERETQIIVNDTDDFDIPSYWYEALVLNIADRVSKKFDTAPNVAAEIKVDAGNALAAAMGFDDAVYPIEVKIEQNG